MSNAIIDTAVLTEIADAVREKTGDSAPIKLGEMADKIESISGGGENEPWAQDVTAAEFPQKHLEFTLKSDGETIATSTTNKIAYSPNLIHIDLRNATFLGNYAFQGCYNLRTAKIDGLFLGTQSSAGAYMFTNCTSLEEVTVTNAERIPNSFINGNTNLSPSSVRIGEGVLEIGQSAFNTQKVTKITLPSTVTSILAQALYYVKTLTILAETPPTIATNTMRTNTVTAIYVPANSVSTYKSATNWSAFASKIKPIP